MRQHQQTQGETDTWITQKYITEALGSFDLDPCEAVDMPWKHAPKGFNIQDDGLSKEWIGRVWVNPPFNRFVKGDWMKKFSEHKNGIMLIPFAGEIDLWKKYVWGKCTGILIMDHRPYFCDTEGNKGKSNSGQTMCLISYDKSNLISLINSGLGPVTVQIL